MLSGVPYRELRPLFPPRPRGAINPAALPRYRGFYAQPKYNDIRTLIYFRPDSGIELFTRQREPHREYALTAGMSRSLGTLKLASGFYHVLDGGILRTPKKMPKGVDRPIILWDILVHESRYLVGTTYRERYALLKKVAGDPGRFETRTGHKLGLRIHGSLWMAPLYRSRFEERFTELARLEEIEGLVLKNPNGTLERAVRQENNGDWQIRVRKPTAIYPF